MRKSRVCGETVRGHGDGAWRGDRERQGGKGGKGITAVIKHSPALCQRAAGSRPPALPAPPCHIHYPVHIWHQHHWPQCPGSGDTSPAMSTAPQQIDPSLTCPHHCIPHLQLTCKASSWLGSVPAASPCKTSDDLQGQVRLGTPFQPQHPHERGEQAKASPLHAPTRDPMVQPGWDPRDNGNDGGSGSLPVPWGRAEQH